MTKLIHISDLHLCDSFSSSLIDASQMRQIQWQTLTNIVSYANENKFDFIMISGDLYERSNFSENHAKRLINILSKFIGYVMIISGNHDYIGDDFVFDNIDIPDNIIFHISNKIRRYDFSEHNLSIFMHSWSKSFEHTPDIKDLEIKYKNNILMIHSGTDVDSDAIPFRDIDVSDNINYIALGHIHKMSNNGRLYYPGSLEPLSIKETGDHGGYIIDLDDEFKVSFVNFASVKYFDLDIDCDNKTIDDIVNEVKEYKTDKICIFRINLFGSEIDFDLNELEYALMSVVDYLKINDKRNVSLNISGFDNSYLSEIDKIIEYNYNGDYKEDLKRKIVSIVNKAGRIWF